MNTPYKQLCVWPSALLDGSTIEDFVQFFKDELGVRVQFEAEIKTLPDLDEDENPISDTGGRTDIFFYIHEDDTHKFAIPRLTLGIRWWEDVIKYNNNSSHLYSKEFIETHQPTW